LASRIAALAPTPGTGCGGGGAGCACATLLIIRDATTQTSQLRIPIARQHRLSGIAAYAQSQPLDGFEAEASTRYPYGARSEAAVYVGDLLREIIPASIEIVAIARRPGVLSKVAIRPSAAGVVPLTVGIGADLLNEVSQQLDGERIQVVRWQRSAPAYIADALGLGEVPPMLLLSGLAHARVLLGEIDVRGIAGWRGLNVILASALTGWRLRLEPVSSTPAWARLEAAMRARRSVVGTVIGGTERGARVEVYGLHATLSGVGRVMTIGQELDVRVTRMDPDEGRIFVSDRVASPQLKLPL
jgi:transcription antitermination factor NusA-like protein